MAPQAVVWSVGIVLAVEFTLMRFVLLIYQPHPFDTSSYSPETYNEIAAQYGAVSQSPGVTPGLPLGLPQKAVTVRVQEGETTTSEGPYVDVKGAVGGYMVFETESMEDAVALAARVPAARLGGAVEVRPAEAYW